MFATVAVSFSLFLCPKQLLFPLEYKDPENMATKASFGYIVNGGKVG